MPYIMPEHRTRFNNQIVFDSPPDNPGELNYLITLACHAYAKHQGSNYAAFNEVIGVLECAKQEFYRMVIAPYENEKRKLNGSIGSLDSQGETVESR